MFVLSLMFDEISLSDENEFFKEAFKLTSPRCTTQFWSSNSIIFSLFLSFSWVSVWLSVSLVGHVRSPNGSLWPQLDHCHYNGLMNAGAYENKPVDNKGLSWNQSWLSHTLTERIHVRYRMYWPSGDWCVNSWRWMILTPCYIYAKT